MSEPSHATGLTPKQAKEWGLLEPAVPLFLQLLQPLAKKAPKLLEDPVLTDPLYATLLIDFVAFKSPMDNPLNPDEMRSSDVIARITKLHWLHGQDDESEILHFTTSNKERHPFWPLFERAIHKLVPALPEPLQHPSKEFGRTKALKNNGVRLYLATVMQCVQVATPPK